VTKGFKDPKQKGTLNTKGKKATKGARGEEGPES